MKVAALIPAYNPTASLITLVSRLAASEFEVIIVVDDGSSNDSASVFEELGRIDRVSVLHHAVNLGKGAAIKTGLNHIYFFFKEYIGVTTIDADGQHLAEDALAVARTLETHPEELVIGVRSFSNQVPLRSRLGNILTRHIFRLLAGEKLTDTQSGLRGIPRSLIPILLRIDSNGYEYELDMLLASRHRGCKITEHPIQTVYIQENVSSHFNPLIDSMRIYFVLFRFMAASLLTAVIDYAIFILLYASGASLLASQGGARFVALFVNYAIVRNLVFYSEQTHSRTFPRYLLLVLIAGIVSYNLMKVLIMAFHINVVTAKMVAELIIFLANFAIQRDFIFTRNKTQTSTDWDCYYSKTNTTAKLTRMITTHTLLQLIGKYAPLDRGTLLVGELGGGGSCFLTKVRNAISPAQYHVIDKSQLGLRRLHEQIGNDDTVFLHSEDILNLKETLQLDLVFSVGLIEHFSIEDSRKAVEAHFKILKPGGVAIIAFPTPTLLYKTTRFLIEMLGLWIFYDERPIKRAEVATTFARYGNILHEKIIWPILLTQMIVVVKKRGY